VSEDGKDYELTVESTIPVPCPDGASSSTTEACTLSLHLSTNNQGKCFVSNPAYSQYHHSKVRLFKTLYFSITDFGNMFYLHSVLILQ
jgi:hypothetical protein